MPSKTESLTLMHVNKLKGEVLICEHADGAPEYARHRFIPTVLKNVLLPDIFEPVMITISFSELNEKLFALLSFTFINGCDSRLASRVFVPFSSIEA